MWTEPVYIIEMGVKGVTAQRGREGWGRETARGRNWQGGGEAVREKGNEGVSKIVPANTDSLPQRTAEIKGRQAWLESNRRRTPGVGEGKNKTPSAAALSSPSIHRNLWIIYKPLPLTLSVCEREGGAVCWAHHHAGSCCSCLAAGSVRPRPVSARWARLRSRLQPLQRLLLQTEPSSGSLCGAAAAPSLPQAARGTSVCHSVYTDLWHSCLHCLPSQPRMERECGKDTFVSYFEKRSTKKNVTDLKNRKAEESKFIYLTLLGHVFQTLQWKKTWSWMCESCLGDPF